jgi:hypothetical protein
LDVVFLHLRLAVAAGWDPVGVFVLRTFSMAVTTPAPQAAGRLPGVDSDVGKALALVALGQTTFRPISFYLDNYVAEVLEFEDF